MGSNIPSPPGAALGGGSATDVADWHRAIRIRTVKPASGHSFREIAVDVVATMLYLTH